MILLLGACTFGAVFVAVKATKDTQVSLSGALMNKEGSRMLSTVAQGTRFQLFNTSEDTPLCVSMMYGFTCCPSLLFYCSRSKFNPNIMTFRLQVKPLLLSKAMSFKGPRLSLTWKRKASTNAPSSLLMLPPRFPQVAAHASALRMGRNTALQKLSLVRATQLVVNPRNVVSIMMTILFGSLARNRPKLGRFRNDAVLDRSKGIGGLARP